MVWKKYTINNQTKTESGVLYVGRGNLIKADDVDIQGDEVTVKGNRGWFVGNLGKLFGDDHDVDGDHNTIHGKGNRISGVGNKFDPKTNTFLGEEHREYEARESDSPRNPISEPRPSSKRKRNLTGNLTTGQPGPKKRLVINEPIVAPQRSEPSATVVANPGGWAGWFISLHTQSNSRPSQQNSDLALNGGIIPIPLEEKEEDMTPEEAETEAACVICMVVSAKAICMPCSHFCVCIGCGIKLGKYPNPACPMCRVPIASITKVFNPNKKTNTKKPSNSKEETTVEDTPSKTE